MTWQPIETAPKDGAIVLVFIGGIMGTGFWDDEVDDWELCGYLIGSAKPTHWMPLPDPPEEE